ncbi:MAG: type II toxin-antitoxin system HicA family toxin [Coriobacteriales bacterium]|jgi:predicted RNA binding protein YcfA (HicA-like mRNA interferase family)|nr:type II toxin-antitoxin system HicA family toxin [Coriobacteriales bacterium]
MPPKPPEIYKKLLREGWSEKEGKGSHRKLEKDDTMIILPYHRKELAKGTWEKIRKQAGWE